MEIVKPQDSAPVISGVDTRPLRQQIADTLQGAILDGELPPGTPLIEAEIAEKLGVSRAPVREALQLLVRVDLVETVAYRGTRVRHLTAKDVEEVYSLRTALEACALKRAMGRDREGLAEALHASRDDMATVAARGDWSTLAREDARFHELIVSHADHSLLAQTWRNLQLRVRQIMALRNLQNDDSMEIFYRHAPIVEAIDSGDVAAAVAALEAHIATAAELVLEEPDSNSQESPPN